MSETIGFVGVGSMGSRMVGNLLAAGHDVVAFDIDDSKVESVVESGATATESPRAVAEQVDVVMSSLPTAEAIESAYLGNDGVIDGTSRGQLLIELSTTRPSTTERIEAAARERGATLVDAPVIGTPPVAERAELTLLVGGSDEAFDRAKPILSALGTTFWHVGDVGDGHRAKLVNNTVMHGNYVVASEALALAGKIGIDRELMFDIIDSGMGGSGIVRAKMRKAFEGDFDPSDGSPIHNARKDVKYALDLGFESDFVMHVAAAVEENYGLAAAMGDGGMDYSIMVDVLEKLDG